MSMTRRGFLESSSAAFAGLALGARAQDEPPRPVRIVLLAGPASHDYGSHEHPASCTRLAEMVNLVNEGIEAQAIVGWPEDPAVLKDTDALVVYSDGGAAHPLNGHFDELEPLIARGMGLGLLHYSLIVDGEKPRQQVLDWIGGYYEPGWSVNPMWTAEVEKLPKHEVMHGVVPFRLHDEWYYHMRFRPEMEGVQPLLTALPPPESLSRPDGPHSGNPDVRKAVLEEKRPQHLAWCTEREDGGRGFGFTGLHWHWNFAHDGFRTLLLNAVIWLAGWRIPPLHGYTSQRPSLQKLMRDVGDPPEGWNRQAIQDRIDGWKQG